MRFRTVPGQLADEVPKGSGADGSWQKADEVLDGSSVDGCWRVPDG